MGLTHNGEPKQGFGLEEIEPLVRVARQSASGQAPEGYEPAQKGFAK